ncbi:MAG: hypothetical protein WB014_06080 [Methanosarcina sp.]
MPLKPEELSTEEKLYDLIDKVVIIKGTISSDPTFWEFHIQGEKLKVDAEKLENQNSFRKQYFKTFDRPAPYIKPSRWSSILEALSEDKAEITATPEDSEQVFIAKQIFEILCRKDLTDNPEDAVTGLGMLKHELEDDENIYCSVPSVILKDIVDGAGFKIPLNELSRVMTELQLKRSGTPLVRYGQGRRYRSWLFFYEIVLEQQREG